MDTCPAPAGLRVGPGRAGYRWGRSRETREGGHVEATFRLTLPRDHVSVPLVRSVTGELLTTLGVDPDCVSDLQVALSEACSNVLQHSGAEDDYDVSLRITDHHAEIEVVDRGAGFDAAPLGHRDAAPGAERGRGIQLMRALVDEVQFSVHPGSGTVVRLEKALVFVPGSPLAALEAAGPARAGQPAAGGS